MNNRQKMYQTNTAIKKALEKIGFYYIYMCPHLRHQKDIQVDNYSFDAVGFKKNDNFVYFIQFKTNVKPSKKTLIEYSQLERKYTCKTLWVTKITRKGIFMFNSHNFKGIKI